MEPSLLSRQMYIQGRQTALRPLVYYPIQLSSFSTSQTSITTNHDWRSVRCKLDQIRPPGTV
jgi:hypothetical protein